MPSIDFHSLFPTSRRAEREMLGGVPVPGATRRPVRPDAANKPPGATGVTICLFVMLMTLATSAVHAGDLDVPHSFSAGTPAQASQVNANFSAVETAVDDNDARIAQLEALVATLQSQVSALQASNVMAIDPYVELTDIQDPNNGTLYATVRLSGVNLQVVDGSGDTGGTVNGLGNLIVGYNELTDPSEPSHCSDGNHVDETGCDSVGAVWSANHRSGSHNLVAGNENSYSGYGALIAGHHNLVNNRYGSISGGNDNVSRGFYTVISGGAENDAGGVATSISGGRGGETSSFHSSISGGQNNIASGRYSSVSGGEGNVASNNQASVSGGAYNTANGYYASVSGGIQNTASANYSSVCGGSDNTASANYSAVSGGRSNVASGSYASVSGGWAHEADGDYDWRSGSLFEEQ